MYHNIDLGRPGLDCKQISIDLEVFLEYEENIKTALCVPYLQFVSLSYSLLRIPEPFRMSSLHYTSVLSNILQVSGK